MGGLAQTQQTLMSIMDDGSEDRDEKSAQITAMRIRAKYERRADVEIQYRGPHEPLGECPMGLCMLDDPHTPMARTVIRLRPCGHSFHWSCFKQWFPAGTCPMCRASFAYL